MNTKKPKHTPLNRLKYHVTGAVERGEKQAIEAIVNPKHTPGPWEVFRSANRGKAIQISIPLNANQNPGEYIATCMGANRESNATLIAAAPEMLEALQYALDVLTQEMELNGVTEVNSCCITDLEKVIAKAEGRS